MFLFTRKGTQEEMVFFPPLIIAISGYDAWQPFRKPAVSQQLVQHQGQQRREMAHLDQPTLDGLYLQTSLDNLLWQEAFGNESLSCNPKHQECSPTKVRECPVQTQVSLMSRPALLIVAFHWVVSTPPKARAHMRSKHLLYDRFLQDTLYTLCNFIPITQHLTLGLKCQIHHSELPPTEAEFYYK